MAHAIRHAQQGNIALMNGRTWFAGSPPTALNMLADNINTKINDRSCNRTDLGGAGCVAS
jgi:hypothetical protein